MLGFAAAVALILLCVVWWWSLDRASPDQARDDASDPTRGFSDDAVYSVALGKVSNRLPRFNYSVSECEDTLRRAEQMRAEFANEPPRLRRQIMGWIDWYEARARDDLKKLAKRAEADALSRHLQSRERDQ